MTHAKQQPAQEEQPARTRRYVVRLGDRGRLVLPGEVRSALGLCTGDAFTLDVEADDSLRLRSIRSQVSLLRGMLRKPGDRRSIVDEFLAERKAEADRE